MKKKKVKKQDHDDVTCPRCKEGVLFDVTVPMAAAFGLKQLQCDKCGARIGRFVG